MLNTDLLRSLFPYSSEGINIELKNPFQGRTFLDNTASTQLPLPVLEHIAKSLFTYANIHRGEYDASQISTENFERAYNIAANLVNARSWQEIIFGRNTTEMINLVMRTMEPEFKDGDNIVTTRLEHNSNYVPWYGLQQILKRRGKNLGIRLVDFDKETGEIDMIQLESLVDSKTKLVTVTGASNFMGIKPDLRMIGNIAHSSGYRQLNGTQGSYFLVDGAQLVPGTHVDVQAIGCDFLAWSFHKMGLPLGVGGLYAKKEIIEGFEPFLYGGDMIEDVKEGHVEYKKLPWIYTAGTPNILGTIATGYGITFMINLGLGHLVSATASQRVKEENTAMQIKTEILLNTPRGEMETPYHVPQELGGIWKAYLSRNPEVLQVLKDPRKRFEASQAEVKTAMREIELHEQELTQYAIDSLSGIEETILYGPRDARKRTGLIAFNIEDMDPQSVAFELNKRGIEARNGNHCASLGHQHVGIEGTVRLSFYVYNDHDDVDNDVEAVGEIIREVRS